MCELPSILMDDTPRIQGDDMWARMACRCARQFAHGSLPRHACVIWSTTNDPIQQPRLPRCPPSCSDRHRCRRQQVCSGEGAGQRLNRDCQVQVHVCQGRCASVCRALPVAAGGCAPRGAAVRMRSYRARTSPYAVREILGAGCLLRLPLHPSAHEVGAVLHPPLISRPMSP